MSWRPLLEGELAARAEDAVRAISEDLGEPSSPFVGGKAGAALFHGYLGDAARANQLMDQAIDALATTPMPPALYGGFTGIAWAAEHLGRVLGSSGSQVLGDDEPRGAEDPSTRGPADDDTGEEIDKALLTALAPPWTGDYDLIRGLAGFGVYALERVPHPSAIRCLEAIIDRLYETAEILEHGISWFTPFELLPPHHRQLHPHGRYDLGVAHGVPGVIGLLAATYRLGIRPEKARPLLEGAVRWVLSHQLCEQQRGAQFPGWVLPGIEPQPSRLAWCYGDPGVAAALLSAARAIGNEEWERAALDIALHAATSTPEDSGVLDAGLCHGAFGLAHIYNRINQAGGDDVFADAARLWYHRGLDMQRPGRGIAGFESWELGADLQPGWRTDGGFLIGAAGMGLALLAGITSIEPEWDCLLMLSIPFVTIQPHAQAMAGSLAAARRSR